MLNIGSLLPRHVRYRAGHLAVICGGQRLNFRDVSARVSRLANALAAMGLRKGDKLALILPNCVELLDAYRAAAALGLVSVPLSPLMRGPGLVTLLRDADTAAVIAGAGTAEAVDEARRELPEIPADRYILVGAERPGYREYSSLVSRHSSLVARNLSLVTCRESSPQIDQHSTVNPVSVESLPAEERRRGVIRTDR